MANGKQVLARMAQGSEAIGWKGRRRGARSLQREDVVVATRHLTSNALNTEWKRYQDSLGAAPKVRGHAGGWTPQRYVVVEFQEHTVPLSSDVGAVSEQEPSGHLQKLAHQRSVLRTKANAGWAGRAV